MNEFIKKKKNVQLLKQNLPTPVSSSQKVDEERRLKRFSSTSRVNLEAACRGLLNTTALNILLFQVQ